MKLVIFDFDGTLFDSYRALVPVYQEAFHVIGEECSKEQVADYIHVSLQKVIEERKITPPHLEPFVKTIIAALDYPKNIELTDIFPETKETLDKLKEQGYTLAIMTGNSVLHISKVLKMFDVEKDFAILVGNDIVEKPKPYPDGLLFTLEKLNCPKEQAVYVGDSLNDMLAAENAGIKGILIDRKNEYPSYHKTKISSLSFLLKEEDLLPQE